MPKKSGLPIRHANQLVIDQPLRIKAKRSILRVGARSNEERDRAFRRIILSIPSGKVSTYGRVAAATGFPLYHRAVARLLRTDPPDQLPWHRVLGAGGKIKLPARPPGSKEHG